MATYLITGASRGIGRELARQLAARGETVIGTTRGKAGDLAKAEMITGIDVTDPQAIGRLTAALGSRKIDVLVNNAGIAVFKPMLETTYEEWSRVLDVNLSGPFLCAQACAVTSKLPMCGVSSTMPLRCFSASTSSASPSQFKRGRIGWRCHDCGGRVRGDRRGVCPA